MSQSWDEPNPHSTSLPKPELNPLQNPLLGDNLGRWAQVYFNNPPEQREQAVGELLRELEGKKAPDVAPQKVRCPACQTINDASQRFCGACGGNLRATETPGRYEADQEPVEVVLSSGPHEEVQWLRERAIENLHESELYEQRGGGLWKYVVVSLVLILAGFGVLEYLSRRPPQMASAPAATAPTPVNSSPSTAPAVKEPPKTETPVEEPNNPAPPAREPEHPEGPAKANPPAAPADNAVAANSTVSNDSATDDGGAELEKAESYLQGKAGQRDPAQAAKLLWTAVGKKNTSALVLLADLYSTGEGVPRNCDQARMLLVAASKKGSTPAAERLRNLETSGCR